MTFLRSADPECLELLLTLPAARRDWLLHDMYVASDRQTNRDLVWPLKQSCCSRELADWHSLICWSRFSAQQPLRTYDLTAKLANHGKPHALECLLAPIPQTSAGHAA